MKTHEKNSDDIFYWLFYNICVIFGIVALAIHDHYVIAFFLMFGLASYRHKDCKDCKPQKSVNKRKRMS